METLLNILIVCINNILEACYIVCWILFVEYVLQTKLYEITVYPLKKEIQELNEKQAILYKAIKKLKVIIDCNYTDSERQFQLFKKKIDELQKQTQEQVQEQTQVIKDDCLTYVDTSEADETNNLMSYNTHMTFPHYRIYNKGVYVNADGKNKLVCLSNQLAEFMGYPEGKCLTKEEIIAFSENYFEKHSEDGVLILELKLRKLFNIPENSSPKLSRHVFLYLIKPHLK